MKQETDMKNMYVALGFCSLLFLPGCFDSSNNTTKDNTDGTKSSVQMQENKAGESK
jgi:hypothetical protein